MKRIQHIWSADNHKGTTSVCLVCDLQRKAVREGKSKARTHYFIGGRWIARKAPNCVGVEIWAVDKRTLDDLKFLNDWTKRFEGCSYSVSSKSCRLSLASGFHKDFPGPTPEDALHSAAEAVRRKMKK